MSEKELIQAGFQYKKVIGLDIYAYQKQGFVYCGKVKEE